MLLSIKGAARPAASLAVAVLHVAGMALLVGQAHGALAAEPIAFTIPADEGYGLEDCLQAGSACGQAVANSWCQSHGHLKAVAFGTAGDVTGSLPGKVAAQATAMLIRCGD